MAASKEISENDCNWDGIEIATGAVMRWIFCPGGAQFRNGTCEAFVKKTKRSIEHTYRNKSFTVLELNTAMKRVACVINSRPIYAKGGPKGGADPDYTTVLTSNMLLSGRANQELPPKHYEDSNLPLVRLSYIQECEDL